MEKNQSTIKGHLDIKIIEDSDEFEDKIETWQEILIHDDLDRLPLLANIL